jgi:Asp-tRNA(Asn)/Glu-tRNA(Gln) amidotransferase A subunit family amidase
MAYARPVSLLSRLRAIDSGETTARREYDAFAARAAAVEPEIAAFAAADWDAARAAIPQKAGLPLRGLPVGVKDIYDTRALPTGYGSSIYSNFRPAGDSAMVALLATSGASLPVKTATTEFAFLEPSATRNPWAVTRSPGGSSAGSAAAVAAGMLPAAIGSQTAGSTVRPASFCGVVGFKPSFGLLPTGGVKAFAPSLDTVGLFTAGIDDMQALFAALRGTEMVFDRSEAASLRVGVFRGPNDDAASPAARSALQDAIARLERSGARLCDVEAPASWIAADRAHGVIMAYEGARALSEELRLHRPALSARLAAFLDEGASVDVSAYQRSIATAAEVRSAHVSLFAEIDVLLTFAAADVAPDDLSSTGSPIFNRLWTLLGLPCLSVPGLMERGMPIGVQLVGPIDGDDRLLSAAATVAAVLR